MANEKNAIAKLSGTICEHIEEDSYIFSERALSNRIAEGIYKAGWRQEDNTANALSQQISRLAQEATASGASSEYIAGLKAAAKSIHRSVKNES